MLAQGYRPEEPAGSLPIRVRALADVLTLLAGFVTGVLSGMFGVGGAVVSTPAIRALGATPLSGRLDAPVDPPVGDQRLAAVPPRRAAAAPRRRCGRRSPASCAAGRRRAARRPSSPATAVC